jgi:tetratricopeptide (TPR) repeat protein
MGKLAIAAALFACSACVVPALAMGGGGGGGGGGYGGGSGFGASSTSSGSTYSDYQMAVRLIKHERYADAIPHLESALADKPHDADILNYLGYTKRMTGDYPSSLDYYKRALAENPNHKGVHEYLGELYLQMNDQPSAQKELDTLASLCPSGCDERDALTKALAGYKPSQAAAANTTTAAPQQATATPPVQTAPATQ